MRRAARYGLGALAGATVLLLAAGMFLTATGPGQRALLGLASWALSSETMAVETGELSGSLFGEGQISRIAISDSEGLLAELKQVRVLWSPSDLLKKRITIESLHVQHADLRRLPSGKESGTALPGAAAVGTPPWYAVDLFLPPLEIGRLEIAEADLSGAGLGTALRVSVSGHVDARNPEDAVSASLSVRDLDRASFATAQVDYRAETGELRLAANAQETAGGVLSTLLDIETGQELRLELEGDGVWDRWRGDWLTTVDNERLAGGSLVLSGADGKLSVDVNADGEIGRFLPASYAGLFAGNSSLDLKADYFGGEKIRLDELTLDAPNIRARAAGTADFASSAVSGAGRIELGKAGGNEPVSFSLDEETSLAIQNAKLVFSASPVNRDPELKAVLEAAGLAVNGHVLESVSADIRVTQRGAQPEFSLSDLVVRHPRAELRQRGTARLQTSAQRYTLSGLVIQSGKGQLSASATIDDEIDGKIVLSDLPLSIAGLFAPDLAPQGTLEGEISLNGTADHPKADYRLSLRDVAEPRLLPGVPAKLQVSATGRFAAETLTIAAKASGPDEMTFTAQGALRGLGQTPALELTAKGTAPLGLANSLLAHRGTRVEGRALVDLSLSGRAEAPVINGSITAQDATFNDPATGISLADASLAARLADGKLHIAKLKARSRKGGTLEASGTLDISRPELLPASFKLSADDFNFSDGRIVTGQASSRLTLEGDLLDALRLSGTADITRLDVRIPQALPASVTALQLKHKNAPDHVKASHGMPEQGDKTGLPARITLSLDLQSANRIFVTGRGLDAQLGGGLRLSGAADDPRAIGEFSLERGRMAVLGRSLDIRSGALDFSGDLDPRLNFAAVTQADGKTITITVTGHASKPRFGFSSEPELPEDEILALLLFDKSLAQLSPVQLVQLASQVGELGGLTGGPSVLDRLKSTLGTDRLDITTTEDGELAVTAGSYVNENLYIGVEQGTTGKSGRVQIDLDVTKNMKLRGEAGADGQSKLGVGFEWEY